MIIGTNFAFIIFIKNKLFYVNKSIIKCLLPHVIKSQNIHKTILLSIVTMNNPTTSYKLLNVANEPVNKKKLIFSEPKKQDFLSVGMKIA
jgi:hypothetical protein